MEIPLSCNHKPPPSVLEPRASRPGHSNSSLERAGPRFQHLIEFLPWGAICSKAQLPPLQAILAGGAPAWGEQMVTPSWCHFASPLAAVPALKLLPSKASKGRVLSQGIANSFLKAWKSFLCLRATDLNPSGLPPPWQGKGNKGWKILWDHPTLARSVKKIWDNDDKNSSRSLKTMCWIHNPWDTHRAQVLGNRGKTLWIYRKTLII